MEVLLIGNSLSRGINDLLERIYVKNGTRAKVGARNVAGYTLSRHLNDRQSLDKIHSRKWDWVILQEQSAGIFPSRVQAIEDLVSIIRANGSKVAFYMTYIDEKGRPGFYDRLLRGDALCTGSCTGYIPLGNRVKGRIAPVGQVFEDFRAEGLDSSVLFGADGHHLKKRGRYLAAFTMFLTITDGIALKPKYWAPGAIEDEREEWQQIAINTIKKEPENWNIPIS